MTGLQAIKAGAVFFLLAITAWTDFRERRIPNKFLAAGLGFWLLFTLWNCKKLEEKAFLSTERALAESLLLVLALSCLVVLSRYAIGFGDVKLLGLISLYQGKECAFDCLLGGLFLAGSMSVYLLAVRKINRKDRIALAPFFFFSYVLWFWQKPGR